jgi:hypothetical protein
MPSPSTNTTEWKKLSKIDYFGLFIKNWLAFNSWYRGYHPQFTKDRECINALKDTGDSRNSAYILFSRMINGTDRESISFRDNLDGLITALNRVTLVTPKYTGSISFRNALIDAASNDYQNLIKKSTQHNKMKLGAIFVIDDTEVLYKGLIEIIYQVRCMLFHGELEPTEEKHQIVKYGYLVLNSITDGL